MTLLHTMGYRRIKAIVRAEIVEEHRRIHECNLAHDAIHLLRAVLVLSGDREKHGSCRTLLRQVRENILRIGVRNVGDGRTFRELVVLSLRVERCDAPYADGEARRLLVKCARYIHWRDARAALYCLRMAEPYFQDSTSQASRESGPSLRMAALVGLLATAGIVSGIVSEVPVGQAVCISVLLLAGLCGCVAPLLPDVDRGVRP